MSCVSFVARSSDIEEKPDSDIECEQKENLECKSDSPSQVELSDSESDDEELVLCHSEENPDYYDEEDRWIAYKVEKADLLCYKFDSLLRHGLIPKTGILYKFLTDVIEIFYDPRHQNDKEVTELFNSIRHLGGRRTVNFIRGPMNIGRGKKGSKQPKEMSKMNFGGPSETVCNKQQAGYTIKSGVIKPLSLAHLKLCERSDTPIHNLIQSDIVHLFPCVLRNDGNALKPSIEYDPWLKENVGLTVDIDVEFVKKNKNVTPKVIRENIVTEVVISAVTTIVNEVSLPCVVEYKSRSGKMGDAMAKSWSDRIKILQLCESCQESTTAEEHILKDFLKCKSKCDECIS